MRALLLALSLLAFGVAPALAQQKPKDKLVEEDAAKGSGEDAAGIMVRTLPFKDGQTLRYFSPDGRYEGYAQRRRLTIRFFDEIGNFVGKAERVSQAATLYYAADGTYIGRRVHQKMTLNASATNKAGNKGFLENTKPMGQPDDVQ